jgi:hypothetical protein
MIKPIPSGVTRIAKTVHTVQLSYNVPTGNSTEATSLQSSFEGLRKS